MTDHYDVVIVGGAAMGSATAYFLTHDPDFDGRVLVLEKDPSYEFAGTARSTSGFRQQFSTPVNIALSQFSVEFLRDAERRLATADGPPGIPVHEAGYLYLGDASMVDAFTANHAVQRAMHVDVALMSPAELRHRFPWLTIDDVAIGSLGLSGEGWFDGYLMMSAMRKAACAHGARYEYRCVQGIARDEVGWRVALDDGRGVTADHLVDCAGTAAPALAAMVGVSLPVSAAKQSVFRFESPFRAPDMPYIFTPDGLFVRPEGHEFIAGIGIDDHAGTLADNDMELNYAAFDAEIWPRLARRIDGFAEVRFKGGWAGHYDMSLFDHNPFIGAIEGLPGFYIASGFSGHGLMQAPGIGRGIAELIVHGSYRTIDLAPLSFARIAANAPLREGIQY